MSIAILVYRRFFRPFPGSLPQKLCRPVMDRGRKFLEDDQRDPSGTMRSRAKSKGISTAAIPLIVQNSSMLSAGKSTLDLSKAKTSLVT